MRDFEVDWGARPMALHYQTEYRMGNRRVHRSYSGYQAFFAIFFDLIFGLCFELVTTVLSLTFRLVRYAFGVAVRIVTRFWKLAVAAMTMAVFILTLPFALLHRAIAGLSPAGHFWRRDGFSSPAAKPDWAMSREV
jgi:hypothetical protein